ncbi:hypothetical protein E2562_021706 [Oryza meyeriana var. granulata]|uniref:Uncharacterized protein n=1 Tax=Oryza meyeriana var. granulata TaxID=110450 RepID=A0A6G1DYQ5_9ORYZ|nr:hypothetical protein E2562_021706 [Oryza meyeriana var. granulata]
MKRRGHGSHPATSRWTEEAVAGMEKAVVRRDLIYCMCFVQLKVYSTGQIVGLPEILGTVDFKKTMKHLAEINV